MSQKIQSFRTYLPLFFIAFMLYPAFLKFINIFFIDLRQQDIIVSPGFSSFSYITAAGGALLSSEAAFEWLRRSGRSSRDFFFAALPFAGAGIMWFIPATLFSLLLCLFFTAWGAGRCAALGSYKNFPSLKPSQALTILVLLSLLYAAIGFWQQMRALHTLSMAWFDWGHFFESLNNFFKGKPFYLNLCDGSFLSSRFTPSLTLLLPVVWTGSVPLFLFTGSLLVSSGAVFVYLISRTLNASVKESFIMGVWYFLIPGVANMNLPLIDGFHEVFMLFPMVLCTVWFALKKWHIPAVILFLLTLGVRETAGVIFAGYGLILFCTGRRKSGAALFLISFLYVIAALKIFMPYFDSAVQKTYVHVRYFSHLGDNMYEIALSPFLKPEVFFTSLFAPRNFLFWLMLLIPFFPVALAAWPLLLPLLPELVMLSVDRRFDTQTLLRHYQISLILVLIISVLAGAKKIREKGVPAALQKLFVFLPGGDHRRGAFVILIAGSVLSTIFFVHYPGLPCSEPQRRSNQTTVPPWEDARPLMEKVKKLIPPGSGITAGPRLASLLLPDYDVHIDFSAEDKKLQKYVLLENFFSFYSPEDQLSRCLIKSPNWELIFQGFIDERSVQLFRRSHVKLNKKRPLVKLKEQQWQKCGVPVPCAVSDLEICGALFAPGKLRFGVRLKKKRQNDAGFRVEMQFSSGKNLKYFTSFGNGRFPADLAVPGEAFFFVVDYPPQEKVSECRVTVVELTGSKAPR